MSCYLVHFDIICDEIGIVTATNSFFPLLEEIVTVNISFQFWKEIISY